eukprot:scaffold1002_cov117-Isochrysis_galbana.AAC.3
MRQDTLLSFGRLASPPVPPPPLPFLQARACDLVSQVIADFQPSRLQTGTPAKKRRTRQAKAGTRMTLSTEGTPSPAPHRCSRETEGNASEPAKSDCK